MCSSIGIGKKGWSFHHDAPAFVHLMRLNAFSSSLLPLWPALLFLGVFFLAPLLMVVGMSLASRGTYGGVEWALTLSNYLRLADPLYLGIYLRSLVMAGITTLVCAILGFPLAYTIARAPQRWQTILIIMILIPFWTNFLVRTYAWIFILRADGLLNTLLQGIGLIAEPLPLLYTDGAVFVGLVYGYLPFMVLPLIIAIERIPSALEEAARDLYASTWVIFRRVIIPLAKPGIIAGCVLVFIPAVGAFITPYLLGGGRRLMLGTLIQQEMLVARDWPFGAALSVLLMVLVLLTLILTRRYARWDGL